MRDPLCSGEGAAPVIVRVAGLPHDTLDAFATPLPRAAAALDASARALAEARAALADALHDAVPSAGPALRRVLLAVRRDAHNGRALRRHLASPFWPALRALAGG
ncbi:MAG TPA: hypothetical protein VHG91_17410, partial [Longimicrobium sp.]|nr:hypothetical protein [Longimicrobium sp.]